MMIVIASSDSLGATHNVSSRRRRVGVVAPVDCPPVSDEDMVRRFHSGETGVFDEIFARHRERLYHVVLGLVHNHADAEEVVQDTFVRAYQGLPLFRGDSSLATWLYRIATNLAHNRYWHFVRRGSQVTFSLDVAPLPDNAATYAEILPSDALGPVREAEIGEFGPLIDRCMTRLNPCQREIFTRRYVLHQSYGTIARALGVELGTVKSRLARARESLRLELSIECPEFSSAAAPADWFEPPESRVHTSRAHGGGAPR